MQRACAVLHCHLDCLAAPHYLVIGTIFDKNVFNIKCVFLLFLELSSKTFLLLRRIQRNIIKIYTALHVTYCTCYSRQILIKLEFSQKIFEKKSNIKFNEIPFSGRTVVHADRRRDTMKLICYLTKAPHQIIGNWIMS